MTGIWLQGMKVKEKLDVEQNRMSRMTPKAPTYTALVVLRGEKGWSTFMKKTCYESDS